MKVLHIIEWGSDNYEQKVVELNVVPALVEIDEKSKLHDAFSLFVSYDVANWICENIDNCLIKEVMSGMSQNRTWLIIAKNKDALEAHYNFLTDGPSARSKI